MLQEIHLTNYDESKWEKEWDSKIVFSHGTSSSRGVAIMLPEGIDFVDCEADNVGRKLILTIIEDSKTLTVVNV